MFDPVPNFFGLGLPGSYPGRDAKIVHTYDLGISVDFHARWPWQGSPITVGYDPHGFNNVYLPKRKPLD
jgi:hypothetical protein